MGPTWVLVAPGGPHDGPMKLVIRDAISGTHRIWKIEWNHVHIPVDIFNFYKKWRHISIMVSEITWHLFWRINNTNNTPIHPQSTAWLYQRINREKSSRIWVKLAETNQSKYNTGMCMILWIYCIEDSNANALNLLLSFPGPWYVYMYRKISNIICKKSQNLNDSRLVLQLFCSLHWSQVLSLEWRCSWSSANRRCSNYIWVSNNFIAYSGVSYIICLTVCPHWWANTHVWSMIALITVTHRRNNNTCCRNNDKGVAHAICLLWVWLVVICDQSTQSSHYLYITVIDGT